MADDDDDDNDDDDDADRGVESVPSRHWRFFVSVDDVLLGSGDGVEVGIDGRRHPSRDVLLRDGG